MKKIFKSFGIATGIIFITIVIVGLFNLILGKVVEFFPLPEWIKGICLLGLLLAYSTCQIYKSNI